MTFLLILPNFNPLQTLEVSFFTFISKNLWPPLLDLVPRLGCVLEKMTSKAQKYLTGCKNTSPVGYNNNNYNKFIYNNNKYRSSN